MCGTGGGFNANACTPHSNYLARGSHSQPHTLQCIAAQDGTWHRGTPGRGRGSRPPTPRDRHPDPGMDATPPTCPRFAGRWPPPSTWGQIWPAKQCQVGGPAFTQTCGCPAGIRLASLACKSACAVHMSVEHPQALGPSCCVAAHSCSPGILCPSPRCDVRQGHRFGPILFFT